jgi:hypothetical protein
MTEVSTLRLYLMRGTYLLITVGLGSMIWPLMFNHGPWSLMHGVACSLLAALSVLMAFGIRYPLQMLPLLLFELLWKTIWLTAIALPLWQAGRIDPETMQSVRECLVGIVVCPLVIPWGYVWANYVKKPGNRWGRATPATAS